MSPEERKKFDEKAVLDKARYEEQVRCDWILNI